MYPYFYDQMFAFLQSLLGKFILKIQNTVTLNEIDFLNPINQLPDENLFIGFTTKIFLTKLENDGDISSTQRQISTNQCVLFMLQHLLIWL